MRRAAFYLLFCTLPAADTIFAQTADNQDAPLRDESEQEINELENRIAQLNSGLSESGLEENQKQQITQTLERATADLKLAQKHQQTADEIRTAIEQLPDEVGVLNSENPPPELPDLSTLSKAELGTQMASLQVTVATAEQKLEQYETAAADPTKKKQDLQTQAESVDIDLAETDTQLDAIPSDNRTPIQQATRLALLARKLLLRNNEELLQTKLQKLESEQDLNLPSLRVAQQKNSIEALKQQLETFRQEAERRRKLQSSELLEKAMTAGRDLTALSSPELRANATRLAELAAVNQDITRRLMPDAERRLQQKSDLFDSIETERKKIQDRIRRFGSSGSIGRDLLYFPNRFPKRMEIVRDASDIDRELSALHVLQLDYADEEDRVGRLTDDPKQQLNEADSELISAHLEVLRTLTENTDRLSMLLSDIDIENRRILKEMDRWEAYASEKSLWFRSHSALSLSDLSGVPAHVQTAARQSGSALTAIRLDGGIVSTGLLILTAAAFVVLLVVQKKARTAIESQAQMARHDSCTRIQPTLRSLLLTGAVAAEWPVLCILIGNFYQLGNEGAWKAGTALIELGLIVLWLNCLRHTVRPDGIAEAHFGWEPLLCEKLRQWTHFLLYVTTVPLFCLLYVRFSASGHDTLERVLFILLMLIVCVVMARLFLPRTGPFARRIRRISPLLRKTQWLWTGVPLLFPLALAVLSATGYHYTATQLAKRCGSTLVVLSAVLLAHQLLTRWLVVAARGARQQQERRRAEEEKEQQQTQADQDQTASPVIPPVPTEDVEIEVFGLQADSLVRSAAILTAIGCCWAIWADVLPALRVLDQEPLWYVTEEVTVDASGDGEDGQTQTETTTESVRRPVTVGSLLYAAFALTLTIIGVRQLPGLLEVVLQHQSSFDAPVRYTITTVTRYVVLIAGTMIVCGAVGLRWGQVQWLAAGLSVGLGFGLQEVFANFIAGLIMLIERPVRIGDIVTIDGVSGVVSRIRIRATSITDWDRREYIVPNREFVTGKLLNWTLSDTTNRVVINVGVAYGTNPDLARQLMMDAANAHPNILSDPGPVTTFEKFGDSSLDLVLRAYLPDLDNRLSTITELHTDINRRFAEAGINIPFPQRDLHVFMQPPQQLPDQ